MSLLLQIEQPDRLPLYVSHLHRDGRMSVTFHQAEARRFPTAKPAVLRLAGQVAAHWPEPGTVVYIAEGV